MELNGGDNYPLNDKRKPLNYWLIRTPVKGLKIDWFCATREAVVRCRITFVDVDSEQPLPW